MQVAFYKSKKGFFNRLAAWWTQGPYSHCELVVGEANGRSICYSSSFRDGGVRRKLIDLNDGNWDIVDIEASEEETKRAIKWFDDRLGSPYDVLGLAGFVLRGLVDDLDKYFCSEAVAAALGYQEAWRFDPNTFFVVLTRLNTLDKKVGVQQIIILTNLQGFNNVQSEPYSSATVD